RYTLIMLAELRHRQRHGDEAGLYRAEESDDVLQTLRGQDHRPIAGRPALRELLCDDLRPLVDLRPRHALGNPCGIHLVVDERVGDVIRLLPRAIREHGGDGRLSCGYHNILSVRLPERARAPRETEK